MKAIELVTCIGGGYYAGCNFQIMLLGFACQVITASLLTLCSTFNLKNNCHSLTDVQLLMYIGW